MERPPKRPSFGSTLYPSQAELDWLANIQDYDQLESRLEDKNAENLMADIKVRRSQEKVILDRFPYDISRKIALFMDIRDVLTMACTTILFALFVVDDQFWEARFTLDFPFLRKPKVLDSEGTDKYKSQPWRRYYIFIRYVMHIYIFPNIGESLMLKNKRKTFYMTITNNVYNKNVYSCAVHEKDSNKKIGNELKLTLVELLKFYKIDFYSAIANIRDYANKEIGIVKYIQNPEEWKDTRMQIHKSATNGWCSPAQVIARGFLHVDKNYIG